MTEKPYNLDNLTVISNNGFVAHVNAYYEPTTLGKTPVSWQYTTRKLPKHATDNDILNYVRNKTLGNPVIQLADAVQVVVHDKSHEHLLVIKEFRYPVNNFVYDLPSGLIDDGEHYQSAAYRELTEETSIQPSDVTITYVSKPALSSAGLTDESLVTVYATVDDTFVKQFNTNAKSNLGMTNESEHIENAMFIDKTNARQMLESDDVVLSGRLQLILQSFINS